MTALIHNKSQPRDTPIASQMSQHNTPLPIAAHPNKAISPHLKMPIASQILPQNSEPEFALNNLQLHKSYSKNKFAANTLI